MKYLSLFCTAFLLFACSGENSNNANNANNANNVNNANNSNNDVNNINNETNNMPDPNNMMGNTNQQVEEYVGDWAPLLCTYDQTCDNPDFPTVEDCENELATLLDELGPCDQLSSADAMTCLTTLEGLACVDDYTNYPAECDDALVYEPCAEECEEDELFITDRGDGEGGCFLPCDNGTCSEVGETCIDGACAYIFCDIDADCPDPQTCDQNEFVCVE